MTTFYELPAHQLKEGMSTADGQDVIGAWFDREHNLVGYDVYTPSGNKEEDDLRRCAPDARIAGWDDMVELAEDWDA
jgi:hypothetical protein